MWLLWSSLMTKTSHLLLKMDLLCSFPHLFLQTECDQKCQPAYRKDEAKLWHFKVPGPLKHISLSSLTGLAGSPWETSAAINGALCVLPASALPLWQLMRAQCRRGDREMLCPEAAALNNAHLNWCSSSSAHHSLHFCKHCFPWKARI